MLCADRIGWMDGWMDVCWFECAFRESSRDKRDAIRAAEAKEKQRKADGEGVMRDKEEKRTKGRPSSLIAGERRGCVCFFAELAQGGPAPADAEPRIITALCLPSRDRIRFLLAGVNADAGTGQGRLNLSRATQTHWPRETGGPSSHGDSNFALSLLSSSLSSSTACVGRRGGNSHGHSDFTVSVPCSWCALQQQQEDLTGDLFSAATRSRRPSSGS